MIGNSAVAAGDRLSVHRWLDHRTSGESSGALTSDVFQAAMSRGWLVVRIAWWWADPSGSSQSVVGRLAARASASGMSRGKTTEDRVGPRAGHTGLESLIARAALRRISGVTRRR